MQQQEQPRKQQPMEVLARGLQCIKEGLGPWSVPDLTLGLAVMAKVSHMLPGRHMMVRILLPGVCQHTGSVHRSIGALLPMLLSFRSRPYVLHHERE